MTATGIGDLILLIVIGVPVWVGWTWLKPMRRCHGKCKGEGRIYGKLLGIFKTGGFSNCADCGGTGREPKPLAIFLHERNFFRYPPEETGPGWRRARIRKANARAAGRRIVR